MIERDKIKWVDDEKSGYLSYKGVKLDLSPETVQDIHHGYLFSSDESDKIILDSYERCLRLHREQILKDLLNDKNGK